jgi:beta-glucanase (GH16 family)
MSRFLLLGIFFYSISTSGADVTFRLNMNGLSGFNVPFVSGTFNNWCGNCHHMTDADGDGIWERTINIPAGMLQYKFTFGNWAGQENLTATSGCTVSDGQFVNRSLNVQSDIVLNAVCWGLCSDCLQPDDNIWELFWSDEFEGTALDNEIWTRELGNSGWGNNELQNYTSSPNNLQVSDGTLKIIARQESSGTSNYTSARIITNNKMEFQYGKIEARIKIPFGQGLWPAFWMLGGNFESVGWPHCGEIDIMEHVNNQPLTNSAIHWFNNVSHTYRTNSIPFDGNDFHKYGAIWNETGVTFMLDDHPFFYFAFSEANNSAQIFQKPFFFLLNVAVGGNWPGSPNESTPFPAIMEVDYVRIYNLSTVSTDTAEMPDATRIYPIPASDKLNISFESISGLREISVFNILGQLIMTVPASEDHILIETQSWQSGVYIIKVQEPFSEVKNYRVVKN